MEAAFLRDLKVTHGKCLWQCQTNRRRADGDLRSSKKPAAAAASPGQAVTGTSRHGQRAGAAGLQNPVASNSSSATSSSTDPADTGGSDTKWNEEDGAHFETGERNLKSLTDTALAADRWGFSHRFACAIKRAFSSILVEFQKPIQKTLWTL